MLKGRQKFDSCGMVLLLTWLARRKKSNIPIDPKNSRRKQEERATNMEKSSVKYNLNSYIFKSFQISFQNLLNKNIFIG